jgi:hypothetical protein
VSRTREIRTLNDDLNELRLYFNTLPASSNLNIGFESLKTLTIWLLQYALLDDFDAYKKGILLKAVGQENFVAALKLVSKLSTPEMLSKLVKDYEASNGTFTFEVEAGLAILILQRADNLSISHLIKKHLIAKPTPGMTIKMKSEINFELAHPLTRIKGQFQDSEIDFLQANSDQSIYSIIELDSHYYHVSKLKAYEASGSTNQVCEVYLIQAIDSDDQPKVQQNYYKIIKEFSTNPQTEKLRDRLKDNHLITNVECEGDIENGIIETITKFPHLTSALTTTDTRLGPFKDFVNATLCGRRIDQVKVEGIQSLTYANKESKSQEVKVADKSVVIITVTYSEPFTMVYVSPGRTNYYPTQIATPSQKAATLISDSNVNSSGLDAIEVNDMDTQAGADVLNTLYFAVTTGAKVGAMLGAVLGAIAAIIFLQSLTIPMIFASPFVGALSGAVAVPTVSAFTLAPYAYFFGKPSFVPPRDIEYESIQTMSP